MSLSVPPSQYTGLSTDEKPIPVDAVVGTPYYETDTFVTYYWTGTHWKTWDQLYKEGRWIAISSTSGTSGIFTFVIAASAGSSTFTRSFDDPHGLHQLISTGTTIDTYAGIKSNAYAERGLNPYLRVVFALEHTTDVRFYCGWSTYGSTVGNNSMGAVDMYPNNSSIGLKLEANGTDFLLYHNNGTTPGTTEITPIAPVDTQIHTFEIKAIHSAPKYQYKIDHASSWTDITTDLPISTAEMCLQIWSQNTVASLKRYRLIDVYTTIDNKG